MSFNPPLEKSMQVVEAVHEEGSDEVMSVRLNGYRLTAFRLFISLPATILCIRSISASVTPVAMCLD